jgi:hypothetical protein
MYYIGEKVKYQNLYSFFCVLYSRYLHTNYQSHQKIHRIVSLTDRLSTTLISCQNSVSHGSYTVHISTVLYSYMKYSRSQQHE